jgi:hypothetical protein
MDKWLKKYVEKPQTEKLMNKQELELYDFFTQGIDSKEDRAKNS